MDPSSSQRPASFAGATSTSQSLSPSKTDAAKPKKPRKKKDASADPGSVSADPKPKKTSKSAKAGPGGPRPVGRPPKGRPSIGRSVSRMSSVGGDAETPQRLPDGEDDDQQPAPRAAGDDEQVNEDDDDDADDGVEELGKDHYSTQEAIYASQQRSMGLLSMIMDDDQLDRHMASRRGALNKNSVRKLVNHVLSQSVSPHVAMVVSGVAKIFVGEMVEQARAIQSARGETGPLRPTHLREAHRQYYVERERPGHYPPGTNTGFPGLGKRRRMF